MSSTIQLEAEQSTLDGLGRPAVEMTFRGHRQGVLCAAFQPSHQKLDLGNSMSKSSSHGRRVVLPPKILTGGADGAVMLWDAKPTMRALRFLGHRGPVLGCDYSPRSLLIASCGHDGYARLVTPNLMRTSTTYPSPCSLQQRNDDHEHSFSWRVHSGSARAIAFAPGGADRLFTVGDDKSIKCWNLNYVSSTHRGVGFSGSTLTSLPGGGGGSSSSTPEASFAAAHTGHTNWVRCLAVPPAPAAPGFAHALASGGDDRVVYVWDTRTRHAVHAFFEPQGSIRGLGFHPDGHRLASGDAEGTISVFDLRAAATASSSTAVRAGREGEENEGGGKRGRGGYGLLQRYPAAHGGGVHDVSFGPAGGWLLSAGEDGAARIWDLCEGRLYCTLQAHDGPVRAARFTDDGRFFVTAGKDNVVVLWRSGLSSRPVGARMTAAAATTTPTAPLSSSLFLQSPPDQLKDADTPPLYRLSGQPQAAVEQQSDPRRNHSPTARGLASPQGLPAGGPSSLRASPSKPPLRPALRKSVELGPRESQVGGDAGKGHHSDPAAGSCIPTTDVTTVPVQQQQQQRERSFERDENRYGLPTASPCIRGEVLKTNDNAGSSFGVEEKKEQILKQEGEQQPRSGQRGSAPHTHQDESTYDRRLENVEHALASLAGHVQKQQTLVRQEIETLKTHWYSHHEKQQDDIRSLSTMMKKLIEQQSVLMNRLGQGTEVNKSEG